jgi:hypothetical protein
MTFVAPFVSELLDLVRVSRSNRFQDRLIFEVKELADSEVRIRVRTSHKAIADQADIQFLHWNEKEFEELQEFKELGRPCQSQITNHDPGY